MLAVNHSIRMRKSALFVLVCYWVALAIGTHIPHPPHVIFPRGTSDKMLHLVAYAGLAFLLSFNWSLRRPFGWRQWLGVVAILAAFGGIDEVTQIPVGRECDAIDWLADLTGIIGGSLLFGAVALVVRGPAARLTS